MGHSEHSEESHGGERYSNGILHPARGFRMTAGTYVQNDRKHGKKRKKCEKAVKK